MSQAKVTKRAEFLDNLMMWEPQHDPERHIFEPNKLEIPCVIVDVQVAEPLTRRIRHMISDRSRNIPTFPTRQLRTKIEIRVFIIKKEVLVQKPDLVKHAPSI